MLRKLMKVLLIILASIIILTAVFAGFILTRMHIRDWKYRQKALQNPEYVKKLNDRNAWKKSLIANNDRIIRVDIYDTNGKYGLSKYDNKSIDELQNIGKISDNEQLKEFKTEFKKILLSKKPKMDIMSTSRIWINIQYDDGTNAVAEVLDEDKTGRLRIYNFETNKVPDRNNYIKLLFRMREPFWKIINDNIYDRYKKENNKIDYKKLNIYR